MEDRRTIVCDHGTSVFQAGFSGKDSPCCVFPPIVGRPRPDDAATHRQKDTFIGDEAYTRRGILELRDPVERGRVTHWDDVEQVWHHAFFNELRMPPEDCNVLVSEAPMHPHEDREKLAQILFETFDVPNLYIGNQSVLSLYAAGRTTGTVLQSGDRASYSVPVFEGNALPHAMLRVDIGGRDLTAYMVKLLNEKGHSFVTTAEKEVVRDIKEKLCCVALDFDKQLEKPGTQQEDSYELPDGSVIEVGSQRFRCPEALFQPSHLGLDAEAPGFHQMIMKTIMRCDEDVHLHMFPNIVLAGGNTMYRGLYERLGKELDLLAPASMKPRVIAPPERKVSVWIGGSILSSLDDFETMWLSKEAYEEAGPSILHQRF